MLRLIAASSSFDAVHDVGSACVESVVFEFPGVGGGLEKSRVAKKAAMLLLSSVDASVEGEVDGSCLRGRPRLGRSAS